MSRSKLNLNEALRMWMVELCSKKTPLFVANWILHYNKSCMIAPQLLPSNLIIAQKSLLSIANLLSPLGTETDFQAVQKQIGRSVFNLRSWIRYSSCKQKLVFPTLPKIALCFSTMIETSEFPKELLKGRLKLMYKSGSCDTDNFHELTLSPSLSRVFEELLLRQLYSSVPWKLRLIGNQFDFLKNSSCHSDALQLVDFIKSNYRRKSVAALFIDLKKAFDTVDTKRFAWKLNRLGLSKGAVKLMLDYLQNRQTATTIGNYTSSFININIGVPQGSKLGPVHFIIYINDLLKLDFIGQPVLCLGRYMTFGSDRNTSDYIHRRTTRRNSRIHNFNKHSTVTSISNSSNAALTTAINDNNGVDSDTRHLTCLKTFTAWVKLNLMQESVRFNVISSYYFINWHTCPLWCYLLTCDVYINVPSLFIYLLSLRLFYRIRILDKRLKSELE